MNRNELLKLLTIVKPALSSSEMVPIFAHYIFTGTQLQAYNDHIGITVPFNTDFVGAVPGEMLRAFLDRLESEVVKLQAKDNGLHVSARKGKSTLDLVMLGPEEFKFTFPKPGSKILPLPWNEFLPAVECCLRSASEDADSPEKLGVTLLHRGNYLTLYSTDGPTLSRARVKLSKPWTGPERVVLSVPFCKQLLELKKLPGQSQLELYDDHVLFTIKGEDTSQLFGKLVNVDDRLDFEQVFDQHYTKDAQKQKIAIPKFFKPALERATLVTEGPSRDPFSRVREASKTGQTNSAITVEDGLLKMRSESARGLMFDQFELPQYNCKTILIDPRRLLDGINFFDKILVTDRCVIMAKGWMVYLVSAATQ